MTCPDFLTQVTTYVQRPETELAFFCAAITGVIGWVVLFGAEPESE